MANIVYLQIPVTENTGPSEAFDLLGGFFTVYEHWSKEMELFIGVASGDFGDATSMLHAHRIDFTAHHQKPR